MNSHRDSQVCLTINNAELSNSPTKNSRKVTRTSMRTNEPRFLSKLKQQYTPHGESYKLWNKKRVINTQTNSSI